MQNCIYNAKSCKQDQVEEVDEMSDPCRQVSARRLPPLPGNVNKYHNILSNDRHLAAFNYGLRQKSAEMTAVPVPELAADFVRGYLTSNPELLNRYVMDFVTIDQLETWLKNKTDRIRDNQTSMSCTKKTIDNWRYGELSVLQLQENLLAEMSATENCLPILYEISGLLGTALSANGVSVYVTKESKQDLYLYIPPITEDGKHRLKIYGPVGLNRTIAAHAVATQEAVFVNASEERADKFPLWIGTEDSLVNSVICVPMMIPNKDMLCCMQFTRTVDKSHFSTDDLHLAICMISWIGMAIYKTNLNKLLLKQAELNDFLLTVTKTLFDGIVTKDRLVEQIMTYAKDLVKADRCSLFLVDNEKQQLYSNLFDDGTRENGKTKYKIGEEIRFPLDKGIAGYVAHTGNAINIADVYRDTRFNRDIDHETGYLTKSILCMPIITNGEVKGVVEMLNKQSVEAYFTYSDEDAFKMFAVYCALALHYHDMYNEIILKTASYKIALEQLVYHAKASDEEVAEFIARPLFNQIDVPHDLDSFSFVFSREMENYEHMLFVQMINNLFGPTAFNLSKLCQFILTVRRNYRQLPYHNWQHGCATAQAMYSILMVLKKRDPPIFTELTMKGLMVAALCHDVDHRGLSNAFMEEYRQPLHVVYKSSIMEQHHFATVVKIIQQEGHDIFSLLGPDEFRTVLKVIEKAIMATDLTNYLSNRDELATHLENGTLNFYQDESHRDLIIALIMSGVDLAGCCKPWDAHCDVVLRIFEEFYQQGDAEKELGKKPQPVMDRDRIESIPQDEVSFLQFACLPCYRLLTSIFPEFMALYTQVESNLAQWKQIAEYPTDGETWAQRISLVTMIRPTPISNKYVASSYKIH